MLAVAVEYVTPSVVGSEVVSWRREERESESEEQRERRHDVFLREKEWFVGKMGFEIWRELRSFW